eukprot:jgi/Mesvir1/7381/Mv19182-RA.1
MQAEADALRTPVEFWKAQARCSSEALQAHAVELQLALTSVATVEQALADKGAPLGEGRASVVELECQLRATEASLKEVSQRKDEVSEALRIKAEELQRSEARAAIAEQALVDRGAELWDRHAKLAELERQLEEARGSLKEVMQKKDEMSETLRTTTEQLQLSQSAAAEKVDLLAGWMAGERELQSAMATVKELLEKKDESGGAEYIFISGLSTSSIWAAREGRLDEVKLLVAVGATLTAENKVHPGNHLHLP